MCLSFFIIKSTVRSMQCANKNKYFCEEEANLFEPGDIIKIDPALNRVSLYRHEYFESSTDPDIYAPGRPLCRTDAETILIIAIEAADHFLGDLLLVFDPVTFVCGFQRKKYFRHA